MDGYSGAFRSMPTGDAAYIHNHETGNLSMQRQVKQSFFQSVGRALLGVGLWVATLGAVQAQGSPLLPEVVESTQRWLDTALGAAGAGLDKTLKMQVSIGALDSRLRLAPCARVEPYLPPGTRLWGKTRLGLRCLEGAVKWNVFLPVTVKALGSAWVVKGNLSPGTVLTESDAMLAEVDWAEDNSPVVIDPSQWIGQVASRALTSGQVLRQSSLKPAQVFQAGASVRVMAQGAGFQVVSDGQAVMAGAIGQMVRVRMENGRTLSGVVLDARTVRVDM